MNNMLVGVPAGNSPIECTEPRTKMPVSTCDDCGPFDCRNGRIYVGMRLYYPCRCECHTQEPALATIVRFTYK